MSTLKEPDIFRLMQPDLLPEEELISMIKARCPRVQNLASVSKERLVRLFHQLILPLPQRMYRTNRRGKLLTTRRLKAGLEQQRDEEAARCPPASGKRTHSEDRLKPPPGSGKSSKIRLSTETSQKNYSKTVDLDRIVINDRRKSSSEDKTAETNASNRSHADVTSSGRKIILKRPSSTSEEPPSSASLEVKKSRTAIKWP